MRAVSAVGLFLALGMQLTACTDSAPSGAGDAERGDGPEISSKPDPAVAPTSYRYRLKSYCGQRGLLGIYDVVERDGSIESVKVVPPRWSMFRPDPHDIPTLAGLLAMAEDVRPIAEVRLEVDADGLPTLLEIDHIPQGIDDEECYEVMDLKPLAQ